MKNKIDLEFIVGLLFNLIPIFIFIYLTVEVIFVINEVNTTGDIAHSCYNTYSYDVRCGATFLNKHFWDTISNGE